MSTIGVLRIVLVKVGIFDYAEVDLHGTVHLAGDNNRGKTSLIAALQFLYVDSQSALSFKDSSMANSRRYYFPDHYSHILFECQTPSGRQVVGVRGLGPLKQYEFERFAYRGVFDRADFVDERRMPREPDTIKHRLVDRDYRSLEPSHLRAALTGVGDAHGPYLGLVPLRDKNQYDQFRQVFQNLLRLTHLKQDEFKSLLVDAHKTSTQVLEIDLSTAYKEQFNRIKDERVRIGLLRSAKPAVQEVTAAASRRDLLHTDLAQLWPRVARAHAIVRQMPKKCSEDGARDIASLVTQKKHANDELGRLRRELDGKITERDTLNVGIARIAVLEKEFERFDLNEARGEQEAHRTRSHELTGRIQPAGKARREQVEADGVKLTNRRQELSARLLMIRHLAGVRLRGQLSDDQLRAVFTLLNPEILALPVASATEADLAREIVISDESELIGHLRNAASRVIDGRFEGDGVSIGMRRLREPDLAQYVDPETLGKEIATLDAEILHNAELLDAIDRRETLSAERDAADKIVQAFEKRFERYDEWHLGKLTLEERRTELAKVKEIIIEMDGQTSTLGLRLADIAVEFRTAQDTSKARQAKIKVLLQRADEVRKHDPTPQDVDVVENLADAPVDAILHDFDVLLGECEKSRSDEASMSSEIETLLQRIEQTVGAAYFSVDEREVIQRLNQDIDGIDALETSLMGRRNALVVEVRQLFKQLLGGLDNLIGKHVPALNLRLGKIAVSDLEKVHLDLVEDEKVSGPLRAIVAGDEMPLYTDPRTVDVALETVGKQLETRPKVCLVDLFRLHFDVTNARGGTKRYETLDRIESNGTTITIKVLVNLMLLKSMLARSEVRIPFYIDEDGSLDRKNLSAIVDFARESGFVALLASPEPRDVADCVYFLGGGEGRVVLERGPERVRIDHGRAG